MTRLSPAEFLDDAIRGELGANENLLDWILKDYKKSSKNLKV